MDPQCKKVMPHPYGRKWCHNARKWCLDNAPKWPEKCTSPQNTKQQHTTQNGFLTRKNHALAVPQYWILYDYSYEIIHGDIPLLAGIAPWNSTFVRGSQNRTISSHKESSVCSNTNRCWNSAVGRRRQTIMISPHRKFIPWQYPTVGWNNAYVRKTRHKASWASSVAYRGSARESACKGFN